MATAIDQHPTSRRKRTDYRTKARNLGLSVDALDDAAVREAVAKEEGRRFYEENRESVDYWNQWVEKNGLPLEKYRLF